MGLFTSGQPNRSGVFARERVPPTVIRAESNGVAAMVMTLPWGPGTPGAGVIYTPENVADFYRTFAPQGMARNSSGVLMGTSFAYPEMRVVRVIGSGAVKATVTVNKTGPTALIVVTAKFYGAAGNSIIATTSAASDGDSNHFDLTISVSGTSGTTTEVYRNLNVSGVGTDRLPSPGNADPALNLNNSALIGSVTKSSAGLPILQAWNLATGSDGAIAASQYTGTAGTGDAGIAALEADRTIRHVFVDDCGNSLRAAVNAALKTHADTMLDRVAYITGNSGQTASAAQTDAGSYVSANVVYVDPWCNVYDDSKTLTLIPGAAAAASMASNLSPSTSIMWRDGKALRLLTNVISLEANREVSAGNNTLAGISTLIPFPKGGFCFEVGKVTQNRAQASKGNLTRTLMGIYIASSVVDSLQPNVGAPNVRKNQQDIVDAINDFLFGLKQEQEDDPNDNPFILDFHIAEISAVNTQPDLDQGNFTVAADVKIASAMERIFFDINYGETVKIVAS